MSIAYKQFVSDLSNNKSKDTKTIYMQRFDDFTKRSSIIEADILLTIEARKFEDLVKAYVDLKVQSGASYSFLNQAVSAIKSFCVANRINLNFPWLFAQVPKPDSASNEAKPVADEPYKIEQIEAMLKVANIRAKASINIMSKGGARVGALPTMRLEHMQLIEKYGVLAIQAYPGTKAAYWVLLPPKASQTVLKYKGKRIKGPLFVQTHESDAIKGVSLVSEILRLAVKAQIRKYNKGDHLKRHKIMLDHGFRKYHSTILERAGLRDDHIARLRGNKKGLKGIYQLPSAREIYELTEFEKAIPLLDAEIDTISKPQLIIPIAKTLARDNR